MKRIYILLSILLVALLGACKGEKNVTTYEGIYKEQPFSILVAPVQDNADRIYPKNTQDKVLNDELSAAAQFMRQTPTEPLVGQGYYVIAPLASDAIFKQEGKSYKQLKFDDIKGFSTRYGVDAILLIAIHKWQNPEVNEVVVYAEYILRSTKTGADLMHTWVRGNKLQPIDGKGEPVEMASDTKFINTTEMSRPLAYRCILMQQMSDFVLRSLPTSSSRWYFQHDQYISANPSFYQFTINPDGSVERSEYNEDAFGNECFTD